MGGDGGYQGKQLLSFSVGGVINPGSGNRNMSNHCLQRRSHLISIRHCLKRCLLELDYCVFSLYIGGYGGGGGGGYGGGYGNNQGGNWGGNQGGYNEGYGGGYGGGQGKLQCRVLMILDVMSDPPFLCVNQPLYCVGLPLSATLLGINLTPLKTTMQCKSQLFVILYQSFYRLGEQKSNSKMFLGGYADSS